ncbi:phosphatidate cytidylyltransferase [Oryzibacter oryziterrae]|uniref:phosphatidate cytidylyltransferase n=1 Tax=Oryzibacter oryziterrae TaxID=2766474 RepID=UPI001F229DC7|nr:phosphatidate cytidylyltransferase [Oryzibacter oryziterrae]
MAANPSTPSGKVSSELALRVISAVVLLVVALAALWLGGWVFAVLTALASTAILYEWIGMTGPYAQRAAPKASMLFVAVTVVMAYRDPTTSLAAACLVALGMMLAGVADQRLRWLAAGVIYAAIPGICAVLLRGQGDDGVPSLDFLAVAFVFVVVWVTDSAAYFAGRLIGGPKLAPRFSPKKTWSGAIGGATGAVVVGVAMLRLRGVEAGIIIALISLVLSVISQIGDLIESAMKRHFGVKDSGNLIPGHGGIMDRVDGLVFALVAATAIAFARTGGDGLGAGLLVW